ncbi:hypothetical protein TSUD_175720 [Trifolium subterraneum]|uniref:Uncharacterized protein n=1 Tax=Trifolium subterraneum TaxID=3900 RepID=A0A2Z6LPI0_TRISU|nr:hypothetical protein TSUD_175720 [Trifolium subterraneum]
MHVVMWWPFKLIEYKPSLFSSEDTELRIKGIKLEKTFEKDSYKGQVLELPEPTTAGRIVRFVSKASRSHLNGFQGSMQNQAQGPFLSLECG